jgi:hypothetical protein
MMRETDPKFIGSLIFEVHIGPGLVPTSATCVAKSKPTPFPIDI